MADNSILTPGCPAELALTEPAAESPQYLEKDKMLSEYTKEEEKAAVRENIGVYSKESVYNKDDVDTKVSAQIRDSINKYLDMEDPHKILPQVKVLIEDMVKDDGSTPFLQPQTGVEPREPHHLATKKYVDHKMKKHKADEDPHEILPKVEALLTKYVLESQVYTKSLLYTKEAIDELSALYIRKDGTTPFTKAQVGADPQIDSHLATKRYVDKSLYKHLINVDPHGFLTILNDRLAGYIKRKEVYDKTLTYSRSQIDGIINQLIDEVIDAALKEYTDAVNEKFEHIRKSHFVKSDGTIPFIKPQPGIDAVAESDLTTLRLLTKAIDELKTNLTQAIEEHQCEWLTSGPVEATVGKVEEGTLLPPSMTLQEILDAIFYGLTISIEVPEYTIVTRRCKILLCIHGSLGLVERAEVYQGDKLIHTLTKDAFENGCTTVMSERIYEDTTFTFKVFYTNGAMHEEKDTTKVCYPVFVGLLPKWKLAHTVTMDYLVNLCLQDREGVEAKFLSYGDDLKTFTFFYKFKDPALRHPFIVLPKDYPNLDTMVTSSQKFGIEAFEVIDDIPLTVYGLDKEIIFKIYVYKLALSSLNQDVTFNFKPNESVQ